MKLSLNRSSTLPLALLLHAGLVSAEQPFTAQELERRQQVADCRILEFTCATCGHITDSDQWDEQNRLISDVEACEKQRAEQPAINKTPSSK
jgi:hypothetical protein